MRFDTAKTHAEQISIAIKANRKKKFHRSSNANSDGNISYKPATVYKSFKNSTIIHGVIAIIEFLVLIYLWWAVGSRDLSWVFRYEVREAQPWPTIILLVPDGFITLTKNKLF